MKLFSSLHDPKHEKYAVYYSVVLIVVIISITLLVNGLFEISPFEGTMMFFEGFVALFMLSRHEKVSHSFSGHLKKFEEKIQNIKKEISKSAERMVIFTSKIPSQLKAIPKLG